MDGTITKSDVLGHIYPRVGVDWSHSGVSALLSSITKNGYQAVYLHRRARCRRDCAEIAREVEIVPRLRRGCAEIVPSLCRACAELVPGRVPHGARHRDGLDDAGVPRLDQAGRRHAAARPVPPLAVLSYTL